MTITVRRFAVLLVAAALALPSVVLAQTASSAQPALDARLAAVEKAVDAKRQELGIPGASLVIVKDDKVILMKGLGLKDYERKLPVTPDTLFAIGSSSKAFTAMAVCIAQDDGKLSLDDNPSKILPYFTLADPDAAAKITIRDLLCHRSGLNRTDLAWASGQLSREEIIKVAGRAKPTAKLGEKFQYQNVMYAAAGEIAARAEGTTYEKLIAGRMFKPLGMTGSVLSIKEMKSKPDYSLGYEYNFATKETRELPTRDLEAIAPAGCINSNARDMAQWLRVMLGGGVIDGKRLVSEKGFAELTKKQMEIGGKMAYGLGWFIRDWNGHTILEHGGNIDGFNAQVAMMPDQKLGFVLLTNVSASPIGESAMSTIWTSLVGDPNAVTATGTVNDSGPASGDSVDPKNEAGTYKFAEAGFDVEVVLDGGKLMMKVPAQPTYALELVSGRRYKLASPAPDGFFATFRPVKDKPNETEMYLEQPQGNYVLPRSASSAVEEKVAYADLDGVYKKPGGTGDGVEIATTDGATALVVAGQPPYRLKEKSKDTFALVGLPDSFALSVKRGADGAATGIVINQPNGTFEFERTASATVAMTVDELQKKAIEAAGGETNLRKRATVVTTLDVDLENQGVTGTGTFWAKAPGMAGSEVQFVAFGKTLGSVRSWFDGAAGGEEISFAPTQTYTGKKLEDARISSDMLEILNWKTLYSSVRIRGIEKVDGHDAYVVVKSPAKGNPVTDYYSTADFTLLQQDTVEWSETANSGVPVKTRFKDYRMIDGMAVPFIVTSFTTGNGYTTIKVKDVKFNVVIPDSVFHAKKVS